MVRESYTAIVERNAVWEGPFATEPYEAAWASEAVIFIRTLEASGPVEGSQAGVQISPDGMHWCDEGTSIALSPEPGVSFGRVAHFGGWLRVGGELPASAQVKVIVAIALKE